METNTEIARYRDNLIMKMLMIEPECPLHIHVVDSDEMGFAKLPGIMADSKTQKVIGVPNARTRHKIAFQHQVPIDSFAFITEAGSPLESDDPGKRHLILWSYLELQQPLAEKIVYRDWDQVDLIIILRQLVTPMGEPNLTLASLMNP